jgi:hypothetical protein
MSRDASYNGLNYRKQGAAEWHISGTLFIDQGGSIVPDSGVQPATTSIIVDNTGGTASTTFAAIAAGPAYAQADMVAVKNALAQIALELNGIGSVLKNAGLTS